MEYIPASQAFEDDDDDAVTADSDGYTFEGYTIEVNKKIELTPSAPPKPK